MDEDEATAPPDTEQEPEDLDEESARVDGGSENGKDAVTDVTQDDGPEVGEPNT